MCPPRFIRSIQSPEINRRSLLKFGLGAAVAALAAPFAAEAAPVSRASFSNVADLTHLLGTQFPLFPGAAPFQITPVVFHDRDGYYGSILNYWEHSGTHMDAPVHLLPMASSSIRFQCSRWWCRQWLSISPSGLRAT